MKYKTKPKDDNVKKLLSFQNKPKGKKQNDKQTELLTVLSANIGAWSLALTDVEVIARIISLLVAAAYTVVKICQATKNDGK